MLSFVKSWYYEQCNGNGFICCVTCQCLKQSKCKILVVLTTNSSSNKLSSLYLSFLGVFLFFLNVVELYSYRQGSFLMMQKKYATCKLSYGYNTCVIFIYISFPSRKKQAFYYIILAKRDLCNKFILKITELILR